MSAIDPPEEFPTIWAGDISNRASSAAASRASSSPLPWVPGFSLSPCPLLS